MIGSKQIFRSRKLSCLLSEMSSNAPIAFFAYKRPEHTLKSLESLSKNQGAEDSELFIYSDGPKCLEDSQAVQQVREIIRGKKWCGTVHIIEREVNLGLANSIIRAVTENQKIALSN